MQRERDRVLSGQAEGDMIVLRGIRKVYSGGKVAVKDASFGIPRGECFGFLVRVLPRCCCHQYGGSAVAF